MLPDLPLPDLSLPFNKAPQMSRRQLGELRDLQAERMSRRIEALKLYQPQPWQEGYHKCFAKRRIIRGAVRTGKSLCSFCEDSYAVTGQDPNDKYPATDGTLVIIGYNWKHFKTVIVPKLFKSGAFLIIKDKITGQWRAYDPRSPEDILRRNECKPAPPLIPKRFIKPKGMHWINRGKGELDSVELVTGWQILCFSSEGQIPQGFTAHRVHIDEDISRTEWVPEMESRCADATGINRAGQTVIGGYLDWSAMPHDTNDALTNLCERADEEIKLPNPRIVKFNPWFEHNYHIPEQERRETMRDWAASGVDVLRRRAYGESTTGSVLMYPTFDVRIHGLDVKDFHDKGNWTRYMVVDPGHQICAVLFAAVPPLELGDFVLLEDELYIEQCDAVKFAQLVSEKTIGKSYQTFIIDAHGGGLTDFGTGRSPRDQYSEALANKGVRSETTRSNFADGSDNIAGRTGEMRLWLRVREDNRGPKLRILRNGDSPMLPNFEYEIKRYWKQRENTPNGKRVIDKPMQRGAVHLMQSCEMLCAYDPQYHPPGRPSKRTTAVLQYAKAKRAKKHPKGNAVLLASHA